MSRKTSKERSLSITGDVKNIFKIITLYENDRPALDLHMTQKTEQFIPPGMEWDSVEHLLLACSTLKDELFKVTAPRRDEVTLCCRYTTLAWCKNHRERTSSLTT